MGFFVALLILPFSDAFPEFHSQALKSTEARNCTSYAHVSARINLTINPTPLDYVSGFDDFMHLHGYRPIKRAGVAGSRARALGFDGHKKPPEAGCLGGDDLDNFSASADQRISACHTLTVANR